MNTWSMTNFLFPPFFFFFYHFYYSSYTFLMDSNCLIIRIVNQSKELVRGVVNSTQRSLFFQNKNDKSFFSSYISKFVLSSFFSPRLCQRLGPDLWMFKVVAPRWLSRPLNPWPSGRRPQHCRPFLERRTRLERIELPVSSSTLSVSVLRSTRLRTLARVFSRRS